MPRWTVAELIPPPVFRWRYLFAMLGPGLLMGGSAIGGGEWLTGPVVTAKYGGAMLWLATLSILGQVLYNCEISRYTLYSGEPIFTGKFRTLPGPWFWLLIYLLLDFGSFFPYLAASAATPAAALWLGHMPQPDVVPSEKLLLRGLSYAIFLLAMVPLFFGGKVYNSLKAIMTFKILSVLGFLLVLAIGYSTFDTWREIFTGFVKFGTVPIRSGEDRNGNGVLDPGEDWDRDGRLDIDEKPAGSSPTVDSDGDGKPDAWKDVDGDGKLDGENLDNIFVALWQGRPFPGIDFTLIATFCALAAIAGNGGLTNTPISNFTRDQGWGMGYHVGAIPSMIGGQNIALSHVGAVFIPGPESLPRWRRWYRHVLRDQLGVWMPACFIGLALPSMLSVQFLGRGVSADKWTAAGMTAAGVRDEVARVSGSATGQLFWFLTLLCGFLVLAPSVSTTADGVIRRWIDVFWTASRRLQTLDPKYIRHLYFQVLGAFTLLGLILLSLATPQKLLDYATMIYNYALGVSCLHTLAVNMILLPRPLRPGWAVRIGMVVSAIFFLAMATVTTLHSLRGPG
ncbi:MAG: Nramp family divalent metal transporter [Pirellulales bacterium]|nr:Nramp family divalent metal transporter [Pirellulales bacterium]